VKTCNRLEFWHHGINACSKRSHWRYRQSLTIKSLKLWTRLSWLIGDGSGESVRDGRNISKEKTQKGLTDTFQEVMAMLDMPDGCKVVAKFEIC